MSAFVSVAKDIIKDNEGLDKLKYLFVGIYWAFVKRLGFSFKKTLWNGAKIKIYPDSSYSSIFYFRLPDKECLEFIRNNSFLGDIFVDVGANVGIVSMLMLDKFKSIVMFEPTPTTYLALSETIALNKHQGVRLTAYNKAVSNKEESLDFIVEGGMSSTNRIAKSSDEQSITVQSCMLDSVLEQYHGPMIMKVDVEGHEEQVFLGAGNLFTKKLLKLVMFERLGRTSLDNILSFMDKHDYQVFRVMSNGNISVNRADIEQPLINLFACPKEIFSKLLVK